MLLKRFLIPNISRTTENSHWFRVTIVVCGGLIDYAIVKTNRYYVILNDRHDTISNDPNVGHVRFPSLPVVPVVIRRSGQIDSVITN